MKILLIVPTFQYSTRYPAFLSMGDFPSGLACLAAALKAAGHEVIGLNPNNDTTFANQQEMVRAKIQECLRLHKFGLIGLGGLCTDYHFIRDALRLVREFAPDTPVVMGNGIVSNDAEFIFKTMKPDFCISGEAEESLVSLVDHLERGDKNYEDVVNLGYWENGVAKFTKADFKYLNVDLNKRPFPDYEPFDVHDMLDNYWMASRYHYRYPRKEPRMFPIVAARSCPFQCTFCVHHRVIRYRARTLENIVEEIDDYFTKYRFNILVILDELFAVNNDRLKEFSEAMLKGHREKGWDFNWTFQTHASAEFDDETLALAKEAGCYWFSYGMESASPTVLASMNKRSKVPQVLRAIKQADKLGIGFGGNFIFGDPAETPSTMKETMDFFRDYCTDLHINFGNIHPYPGSKLFDDCLKNGMIPDKLAFYEAIDEKRFNMTKIPSYWWNLWVLGVNYLGGLSLWVKSTTSVSCERIKDAVSNPVAKYFNMKVCKVGTICPHCATLVHSLELVDLPDATPVIQTVSKKAHNDHGPHSDDAPVLLATKSAFEMGGKMTGILALFWRLRSSKYFFYICYWGAYLASFAIKPFKLLLYLKNDEKVNLSTILTACPNCNKRYRYQVV